MAGKYLYFVEGECEKKFLKSFMLQKEPLFIQGKVEIFNVINARMSNAQARTIKNDTKVILVFDTDVENIDTLEENLKTLTNVANVKPNNIYLVLSVKCFEDELVCFCSKVKTINDLFKTKSSQEFKNKFINHADIVSKLESVDFDINVIWTRNGSSPFDKYQNQGNKIKRIK